MAHSIPIGAGHPRVSFVIVCYNQARYLGDAVQSALALSASSHDVVIVDDGSTDNTEEVCRSFPRVKYICQQNRGPASARNVGIAASAGDYITFLDGDDRLLPNAVEAGLQYFRKYPDSGFVFGRYRNIDSLGNVISDPNRTSDASDFYEVLLQRNVIGMHATVLYSRRVLERLGGFLERFRLADDYDAYLRISRGFPVQRHDQVIAEYRKHNQNISSDYRAMLNATIQVLRTQAPHIRRDRRYKKAFKAGMRNWRNHYGSLMLHDLRAHVESHGLDRNSVRRFRNLAACYPEGLLALTRGVLRGMFLGDVRFNF